LVDLAEEWKDIEDYTRYLAHYGKVGSYQLRKSDEGVEIKVCIGPYGYMRKFKQAEDPELIKMLAFCQAAKFIKVQGSLADDVFYA
jgi:hypothetical protein